MTDWIRAQWDYTVVTVPAESPIALDRTKDYLRIEDDADDVLIQELIDAVTLCGEAMSQRVFITTKFRTFRNGFGETRNVTSGGKRPIVLRKSPFIASTLFTFKIDGGSTTMVLDTDYFEEIVEDYSKLRPETEFWPTSNKERVQALTIEFNAGYGAEGDVPADLQNALFQHVAYLYENRGDEILTASQTAIASGAKFIYDKYRIPNL